ncbi:TerY-C metal binding domain-containing protein [uncultured Thiodictyon sp.]|uniref:TerY-C metal binding domain-containing protein n=1 Tax=uncultured Thiodictyon sp. TaxID=1846217 RepID=UPI0025EC8225|nr:TerY-C metal binding domain-containing protein [uncultured Thiodictyon sp.]
MRRLPIFLVLDVSESMAGDNLFRLQEGIGTIVSTLRTNPQALDTVWLSVIAFAGIAQTLVELQDLAAFRAPVLPMGGGTALGGALEHVMNEIDRQVAVPSPTRKGDWRPIVYLFTDGKPTDQVAAARARWQERYAARVDLVAVAIGRYADQATLRSLTEHVLVFDDTASGGFDVFVRWLTESVSAQSSRVGEPGNGRLSLAKADPGVLCPLTATTALAPAADPDCVVLVGRCQTSGRPYLVKYDRETVPIAMESFSIDASGYRVAGCYPLTEDYFRWSDSSGTGGSANTADLMGGAACPHCGNPITVALCGCGKLMCLRGPGEATCPWCHSELEFAPSASQGFDVERRQG